MDCSKLPTTASDNGYDEKMLKEFIGNGEKYVIDQTVDFNFNSYINNSIKITIKPRYFKFLL